MGPGTQCLAPTRHLPRDSARRESPRAPLHHVPSPALQDRLLKEVHRALKPGGLFYASYKVGHGDGRDSLGRYYNYPPPEWLDATYVEAGAWDQVKSDTSEIKSFDEAPATMLHLVMRKAA